VLPLSDSGASSLTKSIWWLVRMAHRPHCTRLVEVSCHSYLDGELGNCATGVWGGWNVSHIWWNSLPLLTQIACQISKIGDVDWCLWNPDLWHALWIISLVDNCKAQVQIKHKFANQIFITQSSINKHRFCSSVQLDKGLNGHILKPSPTHDD